MILDEKYTLNNGVEIPRLGLGTWFINDKDVVDAVATAIELGYRHIDTAQAYRNERGVGEGIRASGVRREDVFITTKLAAGAKSYSKAVKGIKKSLTALGVSSIDLMIIHSPQPWWGFRGDKRYFAQNREVWRALEEAVADGKIRSIGLSNFERDDVENILEVATITPAVNQILAHISNMPTELIEFCQARDILVEAYSPVAHGELFKNDAVKALAAAYEVSVPQLAIRYCLQLGLLPLPKTANPEHMKNNADVDFVISDEDMAKLSALPPIEHYGRAQLMPVFGGRPTIGKVLKSLVGRR